MKTKIIAENALIAAIYILLTLINPFSFGIINIRVSGAMEILPFFKKEYAWGVAIGLVAVNLFSPLGFIDVCAALAIIVINYLPFKRSNNTIIQTIVYVISSSVIVAAELSIVFSASFPATLVSMLISQIILSVAGYAIFSIISKRCGNEKI